MDDLEKIQETNWWRVCKFLIEVGTEQLLYLFENAVPGSNLRKCLVDNKSDIEQHRKETDRQKKLDIDDKQFALLYFEKEMKKQTDDELDKEYRKTKIGKWDITLIACLLNYFFKHRKLKLKFRLRKIWNEIRDLRNYLHAHIKRNNGFKMTDTEYKQHWQNVEKVLRDLNKFTPQINIEKKIESIQKETVVDGDQLKALIKTFDNWVQIEMGLSEKLNQMEEKSDEQYVSLTNTVNDGVTTVTEEVKENRTICLDIVTTLKENQQILSQIQHQNQNQGAVATDRVPKKMHKGEERLSSQVSMDAEPDEAAGGESVLDDPFLKMTVNEPVESRDESASSLHSDLLKEQRSHNEMPPTIGYIDCLILYAEDDRRDALKFKEHLKKDIKIEKHGPVVALLYDDPELISLHRSEIQYFEQVCELSTFIMLYMTNAFFKDEWETFKAYACLKKSIKDKSGSVVPVYTQKKGTINVPSAIESLIGVSYYKNDMFYKEKLAKLIEDRVEVRVAGNKRLETEKQQRRDKEMVDSHPQQDAFVKTCGQTPGVSANFQEANSIPDLKEDTTDDVDLPSSSHDEKMEQKEDNKRLDIEKQQQRTDKEIIDSHPQQDAFVQICGQTPVASAKIQEANTIPDLEGDTLDDVDLPSNSHDDKMEQKEEAQVASLAEIKQKKKKKKKKKTRR